MFQKLLKVEIVLTILKAYCLTKLTCQYFNLSQFVYFRYFRNL